MYLNDVPMGSVGGTWQQPVQQAMSGNQQEPLIQADGADDGDLPIYDASIPVLQAASVDHPEDEEQEASGQMTPGGMDQEMEMGDRIPAQWKGKGRETGGGYQAYEPEKDREWSLPV